MFIGTTFAWFTDSVSSGVNRIQAGNLDVEVLHKNANVSTPTSIQGVENMFPDVNGSPMKWEPGAVSYEVLTVKNVGSLALKYNISMNIVGYNSVVDSNGIDTRKTLLDVLKVKMLDGSAGNELLSNINRDTVSALNWNDAASLATFVKEDRSLYPDNENGNYDSETFQLIIYWPQSSNDNTWNLQNGKHASDATSETVGELWVDFGINLVATQFNHENDSFDNEYDELATYPVEAFASIDVDDSSKTTSTVEVSSPNVTDTMTPVAKMTVPVGVEVDPGITQLKLTVAETATPSNASVAVSSDSKTFEVKVVGVAADNTEPLTVELYVGKNLTGVSLLHNGSPMSTSDYGYNPVTGIVTFKSATFSPFTVVYDRESWQNHAADSYSKIEGEAKVIDITNEAEFALFAKNVNESEESAYLTGYTVNLEADLDLATYNWVPIGQTGHGQFAGTFLGNNHVIKNLVINNTDESGNCSTGLFGWLNNATVKDLTVEGANVSGHHNVGVIAGYIETSGSRIENCYVNNAVISCTHVNDDADGDKCGGIVGYAGNTGTSVIKCNVTETKISAGRDAGQVVGAARNENVSECSATNVTVSANATGTGTNIRNDVIGRVL